MAAYSAQQLSYDALNSNQVKVMIGTQVIAYAQTTTHSTDAGTQQLYGIGDQNPQEVQQLRNSPSISLEYFELTQRGIDSLGTGQSLIYNLFNTQVDIHIVDSQSGQTKFTYVGSVMSSYSSSVATNSIVISSVSFLAMDVLDNQGNSILNSNSAFSLASLIASAGTAGALGA